MKFVVKSKSPKEYAIPDKLTTIKKINPDHVIKTRELVFQGMGPSVNINRKQFDMDRIDEQVSLHDSEIWEISNDSGMGMMGGMAHPFHAHGIQFQILDRDGNPPPENETRW